MAYEFRLPDIGEGLHEAEILQWFVAEGDVITQDQPIVEVQTDKAAVEIATPVGGKVLRLGGEVGAILKVGEVLIALASAGAGEEVAPATEPALAERIQTPVAERTGTSGRRVLAAPAVRKLARELGVDLAQVSPSDSRGHVSKADVEAFVRARGSASASGQAVASLVQSTPTSSPTARAVSASVQEDGETRQPIRGLRRRIYENMARSMYTAPQATSMDELDASRLVEVRERLLPFAEAEGIKLTYLPFIIKAVSHVLRELPIFNTSVDGEKMEIVFKPHIHIGIAAATPDGLVVPVVHHADRISVFAIARVIEDLTRLARERKLTLEQMSGGTFTISSTGANGGWFATPIVNYPEVAILGVHSIAKKPVVLADDEVAVRYRMGVSLSFDHRIIDGEPVGQFLRRLKEILEHPELLLAL